jgi:hypothetical protein
MYEAPKITKVGSLRDLTLGADIFAINSDDGHYWPGSASAGSR